MILLSIIETAADILSVAIPFVVKWGLVGFAVWWMIRLLSVLSSTK